VKCLIGGPKVPRTQLLVCFWCRAAARVGRFNIFPCHLAFSDAGMLYHAVILTFDPLTLKVRGTSSVMWSKSVRNLSEIEQSPVELLIILRISAYVMSRRDLDLWPVDFELLPHFGCPVFKLHTKFEQNLIISGWVVDDLARFRVQF